MKVNIADIIKVNGASLMLDFQEPLEGFESIGNDCSFNGPVKFRGSIVNENGILKLEGRLTAPYAAKCFRCLREIEGEISLDIEEDFVNVALQKPNEDVYGYGGNTLEIDKALRDNIILNMPMKQVCREDCRGLCQKCGVNLNEGECGCSNDDVDPRLEILKKYFEQ